MLHTLVTGAWPDEVLKSIQAGSHGVIPTTGGMLLLRARSWPIRHARTLLFVHFFAAVNFIIRMSCWEHQEEG